VTTDAFPDLPTFIRSIGVDKAAELFDEKPRTIRAWMHRERMPRPETGRKIVKRSKGRVSFATIYGSSPS
jgi:hypothetical protein